MDEVLKEISEFVNKGLSFLGLKDVTLEAVLGQATQIVMQIMATIILFLFVKFFLWSKITKLIEARQEAINKNLADAEKMNELAQKQKALIDEEYKVAKKSAQDILNSATLQGQEEKERIIIEAKAEAQRRMLNNEKEIKIAVENAKANMKNAIVDIAFLVAEKIMKQEVDKEEYQKTVLDFIGEVGSK